MENRAVALSYPQGEQGDIDNMAAQNGFIMTGHGYYVVKFTVE